MKYEADAKELQWTKKAAGLSAPWAAMAIAGVAFGTTKVELAPNTSVRPDVCDSCAASDQRTSLGHLGTLPRIASDALVLRSADGEVQVSVTARGSTSAVAEPSGAGYLFRGGHVRGGEEHDVVYRPIEGGVEDFVHFDRRPAEEELTYDVDVTSVAGVRLVDGVLELLDAGGAPRLRVRAPFVVDARGTRQPARIELPDCASDTSPIAPWGRAVVAPGANACRVVVRWGTSLGSSTAYPADVDPAWVDGGMMVNPRNAHAAIKLADGRVLVAGGYLAIASSTYSATAEIFDPATKTWAATAPMNRGRAHYGAVILSAGPKAGQALFPSGDDSLQPTADLYNPQTGMWQATAPMKKPRDGAKVTALANGQVLVAGGCSASSSTCDVLEASAEVYDSAADTWTLTTNGMGSPRAYFTLTTLGDGRVLAAGGCTLYSAGFACSKTTQTADVFDPTTNQWVSAGTMPSGHQNHVAALLPNGDVLIAGGVEHGTLSPVATTFKPSTNAWAKVQVSLAFDHDEATASVLSSGAVLISGSWGTSANFSDVTNTAELYNPTAGTFSTTVNMAKPHGNHTATVLADGRVLIAGGFTAGPAFTLLESGVGEIFDPNGTGPGATSSSVSSSTVSGSSSSNVSVGASGSTGAGGGGGSATGVSGKGCSCDIAGASDPAGGLAACLALGFGFVRHRRARASQVS